MRPEQANRLRMRSGSADGHYESYFIRANHAKSSQEIVHEVARSLAQFVGRGPVLDDITFVVAKMTPEKS